MFLVAWWSRVVDCNPHGPGSNPSGAYINLNYKNFNETWNMKHLETLWKNLEKTTFINWKFEKNQKKNWNKVATPFHNNIFILHKYHLFPLIKRRWKICAFDYEIKVSQIFLISKSFLYCLEKSFYKLPASEGLPPRRPAAWANLIPSLTPNRNLGYATVFFIFPRFVLNFYASRKYHHFSTTICLFRDYFAGGWLFAQVRFL